MRTIAVHTLGCKVNQYDTEAMLELFEAAGYANVPFEGEADVYLVNTCTVTGTGDQKSLKLIRRLNREHPNSDIVVSGCLAQRDEEKVLLPGVRLVVGTRQRGRVVELLEQAQREDRVICAVGDLKNAPFEHLSVSRHEGKTRAVMKIQEGCDRWCAYCVIPAVRGPVRSMPVEQVREEAERLARAGYRELVVTGIHLASYGRERGERLIDALRAAHDVPGVERVRIGSLEPVVVTEAFCRELAQMPRLCPQFHLSLQSGCDSVLARMKRRYTAQEYLQAVETLRAYFPGCALTTDVLCGFPGETDAEAEETLRFVGRVAFARIHVFPYSRRSGTLADRMPGQVPQAVKHRRAQELIELGNKLEVSYAKELIGQDVEVLFEQPVDGALCEGYTRTYVRVRAQAQPGEQKTVRIVRADGALLFGE